jgi:RNA polymerase sigma-70 factor, ECF subfamily
LTHETNHIDLSDEKRWISAAKLNTTAFEPLYTRYYDEIYRYIFRRVGREHLSEELCAETFYKALANIKKYTWVNLPFGNWLYTIAANEIRRHFRSKRKVFIIEIDKIQGKIPMEEIVAKAGNEELIWVLEQLSEFELRLIELKYFENKTFKEIGLLLKMKESAIKMRIYRLLLTMRELINSNHDKI